jgi:putative ABC transport system ATP-binding protein
MLSGLERPTKGDVIVNGVRINKVNEKNMSKFRSKEMGFIFQQYNLIGSLTALENVMLPLTIQGVSKKERVARSKAILERLGLGARLNNKPSQMSGGQQQRVSIARSLVSEPKIIFADEPTGNLDSRTTIEILEFLQKIVREQGKTLIMVSHDIEVAMYADRIVHMLDGKITSIEDNRKNIAVVEAKDETENTERGTEVE